MNQINTVQHGDAFETRTFELLKMLVENGDFFVNGKLSKIYQKKSYYSKDREKNIEFDIAIETTMPEATNLSMLTLVECKDYTGKNVPIDDIEEFDSKIRQVAEHNCKGVMVSTSGFASGCTTFARNKGITLIRITAADKLEWILHRKENSFDTFALSGVTHELETEQQDAAKAFFAFSNDRSYESWPDLLLSLQVIDKYKPKVQFIGVPYLSEESIAAKITELFPSQLIYTRNKLNIDAVCQETSILFDTDFDFTTDLGHNGNSLILGKISIDPLKIYINAWLAPEEQRFRFTLAHELGHLCLHISQLHFLQNSTDTPETLKWSADSDMLSRRFEIQANIFASHLLMPDLYLEQVVARFFQKENIHKGFLYWDKQPVNMKLAFDLIDLVQQTFSVSMEAAKNRLVKKKWLIDATDKRISTIIRSHSYNDLTDFRNNDFNNDDIYI